MMALAGTIDIGNALVAKAVLSASVNAASSYALVNAGKANATNGAALATQLSAIAANARKAGWADSKAVINAGPTATVTAGAAGSSGTAAAADLCYCPTGTASGTFTWGTSVTCGSNCTGGGTASRFVLITATHKFTPLFSQYGFAPNGTLKVGSLVQVQ